MMKSLILAVSLLSVSSVFAAGPATGPDAVNIDNACKQDAATANCGNEQVGTGLLKCLHAYKKANKNYTFTPSCKAAMEKARAGHAAHQQGNQ